jgi:hypothetical protein
MRNNKLPGFQIFWPFFALLLVANGLGFSSVVLWPKPEAVTLGGLCLLASFGALIAICRAAGPPHTVRARRAVTVVSTVFGVAFAALAWWYRSTSPGFSLASLLNAPLLLLAVMLGFLLTRSGSQPQQ